ncbi:MAG: outer membrane beta-barrel protein [Cyclobacteriaceae bacterium]|nr:outer membrane beta-barrel protein [Cyclobacteriaceae bacterium]
MQKLCLIIGLSLFYCVAHGQHFHKGYITKDGQKTEGYINYKPTKKDKRTIKFKATEGELVNTYQTEDIDGFYLENYMSEFISVSVNDTAKIFSEVKGKGTVTLSSYENKFFLTKDGNSINFDLPVKAKNTNTHHDIASKRIMEVQEMGRVKNFLSDCDDLDFINLNRNTINKIVDLYNSCTGNPTKRTKPKTIMAGLNVGLNYSLIRFETGKGSHTILGEYAYLGETKFDPSIGYRLGAEVEFLPGSFLDKTSLTTGLLYSHNKYTGKGKIVRESFNTTQINEIEFEVHRVEIPFALKKYFNPAQQGFFISPSFVGYLVVDQKQYRYFEDYILDFLQTSKEEFDFLPYRKFSGMAAITPGFDKFLNKKMKFSIGVTLGYDLGFIDSLKVINPRMLLTGINTALKF